MAVSCAGGAAGEKIKEEKIKFYGFKIHNVKDTSSRETLREAEFWILWSKLRKSNIQKWDIDCVVVAKLLSRIQQKMNFVRCHAT